MTTVRTSRPSAPPSLDEVLREVFAGEAPPRGVQPPPERFVFTREPDSAAVASRWSDAPPEPEEEG